MNFEFVPSYAFDPGFVGNLRVVSSDAASSFASFLRQLTHTQFAAAIFPTTERLRYLGYSSNNFPFDRWRLSSLIGIAEHSIRTGLGVKLSEGEFPLLYREKPRGLRSESSDEPIRTIAAIPIRKSIGDKPIAAAVFESSQDDFNPDYLFSEQPIVADAAIDVRRLLLSSSLDQTWARGGVAIGSAAFAVCAMGLAGSVSGVFPVEPYFWVGPAICAIGVALSSWIELTEPTNQGFTYGW